MTITDKTLATAFYNTKATFLNGRDWNDTSAIGKNFNNISDYFEKKFDGNPNKNNLAYEMAMAAVLNKYNAGVTLNKKDVAGHFKPLVVKPMPDPKKPKRTIYVQDCL